MPTHFFDKEFRSGPDPREIGGVACRIVTRKSLMAALPRVSIIIVSWNARVLLEQFLPTVVATEYPNLEIIVADNASTDDSVQWMQERHPEVTIVQHPENWLFCKGNNEAVPHSSGEYVVFLNNDVAVPPGWLMPLVELMENNPDVGAVQPKILNHARPDEFEYAGAAGGFLDRYGYPFARGRLFTSLEKDTGQYDNRQDIFWAGGAAFMVRKMALDDVGLFDTLLEMHMEEIDLCWRLWKSGWKVMIEPASSVYHVGGGSLSASNPKKAYYNFRNSFLLLYKHLPRKELRRITPGRYMLDTLAALRSLAFGRFGEFVAVVRAHGDYRKLRKQIVRLPDDQQSVLPPYRKSIVWSYFLKRIRRFSDLPRDHFLPSFRDKLDHRDTQHHHQHSH